MCTNDEANEIIKIIYVEDHIHHLMILQSERNLIFLPRDWMRIPRQKGDVN